VQDSPRIQQDLKRWRAETKGEAGNENDSDAHQDLRAA
jgi:hypothetical protein